MAWKTVQTHNFFPDADGIVFNEIASLMAMNEALVEPVMNNFWSLDRGLVGSPNPRQDYLHDLYFDFSKDNEQDNILMVLEYGATRSGKTVGTIALFVKILVKYPGTKALGARRTYTQLADSLVPSVVEFLSKVGYNKGEDYEFRGGDRPGLYFKNGSSWVFRSTENANKAGEGKADNLGGTEYDIVLLEECDEIQELFFDTVVGRMSGQRAPARMICCIENPPSEEHWTYKKWFTERAIDPQPNVKAIHYPTEDNERNLPQGYISSLEEAYKDSPALYRKFRLGLFTPSIKGKPIFKNYFNRKIHVPAGDKTLTWNPRWPIWRIWDFGFRRPACVFAQEDKDTGQIKWLRAHLGNDEMLMPFAKKMINNSKKWYTDARGNTADFIDICDQAGKKRSSTSDKTEIQVLEGLGLRPRYRFSKIEYGVQLLYQELSSILPGGVPAMIFDPVHCGILIDAFEFGYTQDPDAKDDAIKPVKDGRYDHCMDCCRYAVVMFREITNATVPKKVAKRLYRTLTNDGSYAETIMRELQGRRGPVYNFGKPRRNDDG
jgi:hypothetical protein